MREKEIRNNIKIKNQKRAKMKFSFFAVAGKPDICRKEFYLWLFFVSLNIQFYVKNLFNCNTIFSSIILIFETRLVLGYNN